MVAFDLDTVIRLADEGKLTPEQSAVALGTMARQLETTAHSDQARRLTIAGRRLATPEVIERLLEAAAQPGFDRGRLAGALRMRGVSVVPAILRRLESARDDSARRPYEELAARLASFPELRDTVVGTLRAVRAA